jgi:hypothetical protein
VAAALRTRQRRKASKSSDPTAEPRDPELATEPGGEVETKVSNGKGATATVMWNGCGRVEFFEGCERRRGECPGTPAQPVSYRSDRTLGSRKHGEPHDWQRDATSPRPPGGGNHRGGAKPRGWNGIPKRDASGPKRAATHAGVDARQGRWRGGVTNPKGGGRRNPTRTTANSFEGEPRPEGPHESETSREGAEAA